MKGKTASLIIGLATALTIYGCRKQPDLSELSANFVVQTAVAPIQILRPTKHSTFQTLWPTLVLTRTILS